MWFHEHQKIGKILSRECRGRKDSFTSQMRLSWIIIQKCRPLKRAFAGVDFNCSDGSNHAISAVPKILKRTELGMQNDIMHHAEYYSDAGRSSSGSRNEKTCQFSQARRKSGRAGGAKRSELTASIPHFSPLPLKTFKGPLASFCGRALFEPKLAEIRPSQRI